jgi:hypothetical protein
MLTSPETPNVVSSVRSVLTVVVATVLVGCGLGEFEDRTAVVELGGSTTTYEVDACGLDGRTVFVVARADDGAVLQAVMGLEPDSNDGIVASTGLTLDADPNANDTRVAAFGPEAWTRRGSTGPPPGSIAAARLRGSRVRFDGTVVPVDSRDRPVPGGDALPFSLDARCDLDE